VIRDDAGLWHLFYTGTTKAEKMMRQRIGHATSTDLHSWERVGDGLCLDLTGPNATPTRKTTWSATGTTAPCATLG